mgnify:CR=1 FL=1
MGEIATLTVPGFPGSIVYLDFSNGWDAAIQNLFTKYPEFLWIIRSIIGNVPVLRDPGFNFRVPS